MVLIAFLAAAGVGLLDAAPTRAEGLESIDNSLKWVPADAAFYSVSLHNREQLEAVAKSKAWASFQSLPVVQKFWKKIREDLYKEGGPLEKAGPLAKVLENRQLIDLVGDMFAEEVFVCGGQAAASITPRPRNAR